jgi:hypothetical protein
MASTIEIGKMNAQIGQDRNVERCGNSSPRKRTHEMSALHSAISLITASILKTCATP